jgi:hypothetical protein
MVLAHLVGKETRNFRIFENINLAVCKCLLDTYSISFVFWFPRYKIDPVSQNSVSVFVLRFVSDGTGKKLASEYSLKIHP